MPTWKPRSSTIDGFWGGTVKEPSNILELNQGVKEIVVSFFQRIFSNKVHIFWEGHKILLNLHHRFVLSSSFWKILSAFSEYMNFEIYHWLSRIESYNGFFEKRFCFKHSMNQNSAKIVNKSDQRVNLLLSCACKTTDIP